MKKTIQVNNQNIEYSIKRNAKSKTLRLSVFTDGRVVLTFPKRASLVTAEKYLKEKAQWVADKLTGFASSIQTLKAKDTKADFKKYKKVALAMVTEKVEWFSKLYGLKYNSISIKNQRTRWGSCSSSKNLNFNYKIALLPNELVDYIVVHELCHLKEMNHSAKFWQLVAKTIPNYMELRKQLKSKGLEL